MQDSSINSTKMDIYINQNSSIFVNINYAGREYSIQQNGKGLKISCAKGMKVEVTDIDGSEDLIIE